MTSPFHNSAIDRFLPLQSRSCFYAARLGSCKQIMQPSLHRTLSLRSHPFFCIVPSWLNFFHLLSLNKFLTIFYFVRSFLRPSFFFYFFVGFFQLSNFALTVFIVTFVLVTSWFRKRCACCPFHRQHHFPEIEELHLAITETLIWLYMAFCRLVHIGLFTPMTMFEFEVYYVNWTYILS